MVLLEPTPDGLTVSLFSATFGGLLSGFAGVATFHMAHLLFAGLL